MSDSSPPPQQCPVTLLLTRSQHRAYNLTPHDQTFTEALAGGREHRQCRWVLLLLFNNLFERQTHGSMEVVCGDGKKETSYLLVYFPNNLRQPWQCVSPAWVAGSQLSEPSLLPPRGQIIKEAGIGSRPGTQIQVL